jgi:hypothetical protein
MSSAIGSYPVTVEAPRDPMTPRAIPSAADIRGGVWRLRLHGATIYACRQCRSPIRVVSAAYLPEHCPACGRGTWTAGGRCAVTAACGTARPTGDGSHAHCPGCGESAWRRVRRVDAR